MRRSSLVLSGLLATMSVAWIGTQDKGKTETPAVLNFKMKSLAGKDTDLATYKGKVLLVVNVASECG